MLKTKVAVLVGALAVSGIASADLSTGLMAHYSFDDCSANDNSSNNNHGTVNGNLSCIAGVFNKALQFDGTSYINVPNSASLHPVKQLTMSFWVRVDALPPVPGTAPIFYKGQADFGCYKTREYSEWLDNPTKRYETIVAGDGICKFDHVDWNDTATANNTVAPLGKWQYFVGVIDRVKHTAKIYLDGKLKTNEVDGYSTFNNNNSDLRIGYGAEGIKVAPIVQTI